MELVERDATLETLRARLSHIVLGGHAVLVAGEAGVGKTSVLRALGARQAAQRRPSSAGFRRHLDLRPGADEPGLEVLQLRV